MYIKFIKNYKDYKNGDVIKINDFTGSNLIKNGYAKKIIKKTYKIKNLYVAPIIEPNCKMIIHSDGIVKHIGVFTREEYGFAEIRYVYTHVLTDTNYETNNTVHYDYTDDCVVDERKEKNFSKYFFRKMVENGWTENSLITEEDIREIENELNGITTKQTNTGKEC